MNTKSFDVLVAGLIVLVLAPTVARAAERPNVLFLFSDDQRRDTIAALGNPHIQTPNLDRLVREGTSFSQAYCMGSMSGAVCAPSRIMVMTGRTLWRIEGWRKDLKVIYNMTNDDDVLLPEVFRYNGYDTFSSGKNHNGRGWFHRSFTHGKAIFFGGMGSHTTSTLHDYDPAGEYGKKVERPIESFSSTDFANGAIDFLRQRQPGAKPFFAYVSFTAPHDPRTPPGKYATMYDPAKLPLPKNWMPLHPFDNGNLILRDEKLAPFPRTEADTRKQLADYYGMISHMDAQIGRILKALKDAGEYDNTIVVFAGDHGLAVGSHGLFGKQNLYEHSMGTPLIFAGPGIPQNKRTDAMAYLLDIFPTLCEMAGLEIPVGVEGRSLWPIMNPKARPVRQVRDSIYLAYLDVQRAIRDERYKLIVYPKINKIQLFDLETDPHELKDLSAVPRHAKTVARLMNLLATRQKMLGDTAPLRSAKPAPEKFDWDAYIQSQAKKNAAKK
ncbi:MAG: sulfatase-like hydrolase/transferase [Planctomycetota bacterium]|jgi:arylsulfatase A-like enzyme